MDITVVGCGYLGTVHAVCLVEAGHHVTGVDVDPAKLQALREGKAPFYEPELQDALQAALATGRLRFIDTSELTPRENPDPAVHFICVGTPQRDGEFAADMRYIDAALASLLPVVRAGDVVAGKSTVPVGTAARLASQLSTAAPGVMLAWNPEFLREGHAVADTRSPDRIIYGLPEDPQQAQTAGALLDEVYAAQLSHGTPVIRCDYATSELVKTAANAFLATKISFINAMAEVCEAAGADVKHLAQAIGYDDRIGHKFLGPGLGFGGGCLPKDIRAFMARAGELGVDQALTFLREVDAINTRRRLRMVDLAREVVGGSLQGKRIAVLGAAFKPNSDDIRDSPALSVAAHLQQQGADVVVTDPVALDNVRQRWPHLPVAETAEEACTQADAVLLLTEWKQYRDLDPVALGSIVQQRNILDGRCALLARDWRAAGWTYRALGRPKRPNR